MGAVLQTTLTGLFSVTVEARNKNPGVWLPQQGGQYVGRGKMMFLKFPKLAIVPTYNFLYVVTLPAYNCCLKIYKVTKSEY